MRRACRRRDEWLPRIRRVERDRHGGATNAGVRPLHARHGIQGPVRSRPDRQRSRGSRVAGARGGGARAWRMPLAGVARCSPADAARPVPRRTDRRGRRDRRLRRNRADIRIVAARWRGVRTAGCRRPDPLDRRPHSSRIGSPRRCSSNGGACGFTSSPTPRMRRPGAGSSPAPHMRVTRAACRRKSIGTIRKATRSMCSPNRSVRSTARRIPGCSTPSRPSVNTCARRRTHAYSTSAAAPRWVSELLAKLGYTPVTLDVSTALLSVGRRRFDREHLTARLVAGDMTALPIADATMSAVIVIDALHHVPDVPAVFREAFRVLDAGGAFLLAEPGEGHAETEKSRGEMLEFGVHEREIHVAEMFEYARRAGFDDVRVVPNPAPSLCMTSAQLDAATHSPADSWTALNEDRVTDLPAFILQSVFDHPLFVCRKGRRAADSMVPSVLRADHPTASDSSRRARQRRRHRSQYRRHAMAARRRHWPRAARNPAVQFGPRSPCQRFRPREPAFGCRGGSG